MTIKVSMKIGLLVLIALIGTIVLTFLMWKEVTDVYDAANFANVNTVPSFRDLDMGYDAFSQSRERLWQLVEQQDDQTRLKLEQELTIFQNAALAALVKYEKENMDEPQELFVPDKSNLEASRGLLEQEGDLNTRVMRLVDQGNIKDAKALVLANAGLFEQIRNSFDAHRKLNLDFAAKASVEAIGTRTGALLLFTVVAVLTLLIVGLIGAVVSTQLVRRIKMGVRVAEQISRGDLTSRLNTTAKDETGQLIQSLARMQQGLGALVGKIEETSSMLGHAGGKLGQAIEETKSAVSAIDGQIEAVRSGAQTQATSVTEVSATISQIVKGIELLRADIDNQAAAVNQSSASIEQMTSNIALVSNSADHMGQEFQRLIATSDEGQGKLRSVSTKIAAVNERSHKLLDANNAIKAIAAQTNLLAMNAAIEAAHAGNAGRGFAVVSAEIRKLAESSTGQANQINSDITSILSEIGSVIAAVNEAEHAFTRILEEIKLVDNHEKKIVHAMSEQSQGSKQLLEATNQITAITNHVRDGATEITEGSRTISKEMETLAALAEELRSNMGQIDSGAKQILGAILRLEESGHQNAQQIVVLSEIVGQFKI